VFLQFQRGVFSETAEESHIPTVYSQCYGGTDAQVKNFGCVLIYEQYTVSKIHIHTMLSVCTKA